MAGLAYGEDREREPGNSSHGIERGVRPAFDEAFARRALSLWPKSAGLTSEAAAQVARSAIRGEEQYVWPLAPVLTPI